MKRSLVLLLIILTIILCAVCPALSENAAGDYKPEALDQFSNAWNDYYSRNGIKIEGGYLLKDDDQTKVKRLFVAFNKDCENVGYESGILPPTVSLIFLYDLEENFYGFCVAGDDLKDDLEKVLIYTDDAVISDALVGSTHEDGNIWTVILQTEQVLDLYALEGFTIRLTINGENKVLYVSKENIEYLYEMVTFLFRAQLYGDATYDRYMSADLLPEEARATESPERNREDYSFREDYDSIDRTAKSLFYVEIYDSEWNIMGSASGFIAFDEHLFVTNQHVIEGASYLKVWDDDDNMYIIDKVVDSDERQDIALLLFPEGERYAALELNGDEELKRGQPVVTIGSPKGYQNSVAYGNISAFMKRDTVRFIQFTAPISHGSSGGCLFDDRGRVIGITSETSSEGQNLNFAIPIALVQQMYARWNGSDYEQLGSKRSWDMVSVTPTPAPEPTPVVIEWPDGFLTGDETRDKNQDPEDRFADLLRGREGVGDLGFSTNFSTKTQDGLSWTGEDVYQVASGGAASDAGLRNGDLIVFADGVSIDTAETLPRILAGKQKGDHLYLSVLRMGQIVMIDYVVPAEALQR